MHEFELLKYDHQFLDMVIKNEHNYYYRDIIISILSMHVCIYNQPLSRVSYTAGLLDCSGDSGQSHCKTKSSSFFAPFCVFSTFLTSF